MHEVFKGIVTGFIGFILWGLFSIVEGLNEAFGEATAFGTAGMVLGFALMVGGPVVYIVVLPVAGWVRRWRSRRHGEGDP